MLQLANAMKVMNNSQLSRLQSETKVENVQNNYIDIEATVDHTERKLEIQSKSE